MPAGGGIDKPAPDRSWFARGAEGDEAFTREMNKHVDSEIGGGVKQVRSLPDLCWRLRSRIPCNLAQARLKHKQENNMGLFNDWLGRAGFGQVTQWEKQDGRRQLVPLLDAAGKPKRVSPAAIIDYMLKMVREQGSKAIEVWEQKGASG